MSRHQSKRRWLIAAAIICEAANTPALADDAAKRDELSNALSHYIVQSVPPGVPVSGTPAPIKLTDDQRAQIRSVLATRDTEVTSTWTRRQARFSLTPVQRFRRRSSRRHFRKI
jgi:uncharacterized protein (DUF1684 family)